jgi:hypothetical protein
MREAMAVTGYVDANSVKALKSAARIEVFPERDMRDVRMQLSGEAIEEIRSGASEGGLTLVQLILRPGARVQTIVEATADPKGLRAYHDPLLDRIRQEATAKKIFI